MTGFCILLKSCKSEQQIKYEQYVIAGEALYTRHCANCHGRNGEGLRNLYPALDQSAKLGETAYLVCLIQNGTTGKTINMPANNDLYAIDIAQIITYLNERWGEKKMTETEEVAKIACGESEKIKAKN